MGLARFDPADQPQGPIPVGSGRVQIRTIRHSSVGDLSKVTVVDPARGIVLEQNLNHPAADVLSPPPERTPIAAIRSAERSCRDISRSNTQRPIDDENRHRRLAGNTLGPQNARFGRNPITPAIRT